METRPTIPSLNWCAKELGPGGIANLCASALFISRRGQVGT